MGKFFDISYVFYSLWPLLQKLPITLGIVVAASFFGWLLSLLLACIRLRRIPVLSQIVVLVISFLRGTPMIVQLFIVYYGTPLLLALVGIDATVWDKMIFVVAAYSINEAGFGAEILRSAIEALPKGQTEAAQSIGMTSTRIFFRVVFPQALRIALPSIGLMVIGLLKDTSMAFSLGILDLTGEAKALSTVNYRKLECYVGASIIFVVLTILLEQLFRFLEKKTTYTRAVNQRAI